MIMIGFPFTLRLSLKNLKIKAVDYFKKSISGNLLLYAFVYFVSVGMLRYWYPKNIFFVLAEMAVIYSVSLILYYAGLNRSERLDIKRLFLKQAS